jgi:hypothetical protein
LSINHTSSINLMLIKVFEAKNGEKNEQDFLKEFAIQE